MVWFWCSSFSFGVPTTGKVEAFSTSWSEDTASPFLWESFSPSERGVVGGEPASASTFPEAVGIVFEPPQGPNYVGCTGTLVHEDVVITAAHCVVDKTIAGVIVASSDWRVDGTFIAADLAQAYPGAQWPDFVPDVAVIRLEEPSDVLPAAIGIECIADDYLVDGAPVIIVGFGGVNESGVGGNSQKHFAESVVADADCNQRLVDGVVTGCETSIAPGGELAAGGDGVDACFGDSGGPLFLPTERGTFVVGITSRAYAGVDANRPCGSGGIWVRPDAFVSWIEEATERDLSFADCNEPPVAEDVFLQVTTLDQVVYTLQTNDPDGLQERLEYELFTEPEYGSVEFVSGELIYQTVPRFIGTVEFEVVVSDRGKSKWPITGQAESTRFLVSVEVLPHGQLSPSGSSSGQCGCESTNQGFGGLCLLLGPLLLAKRRRNYAE